MAIDSYVDLITSEHATKPKFIAWLSSPLQIIDDNTTLTSEMPTYFDIDNAIGNQLDVLGHSIGRSRVLNFQPTSGSPPTLDDASYRIALKAKIALNQWDGTIPSIYDIWNSLLPNNELNIVDNQNMTMSVLINGDIDPVINEMVVAGYIVPKPTGVGITIIEVTNTSGTPYIGGLVTTIEQITITVPSP